MTTSKAVPSKAVEPNEGLVKSDQEMFARHINQCWSLFDEWTGETNASDEGEEEPTNGSDADEAETDAEDEDSEDDDSEDDDSEEDDSEDDDSEDDESESDEPLIDPGEALATFSTFVVELAQMVELDRYQFLAMVSELFDAVEADRSSSVKVGPAA